MRRVALAQRFGCFADFALAGQEDQRITGAEAGKLVYGIGNRIVQIALVVFLFQIGNWPVTNIDRVQPPGHFDHRRAAEVLRKTLGIDRCRGDDHFQVGALGQQLLEVAKQEVDIQAALVCLVDDDRVVGAEIGVGL